MSDLPPLTVVYWSEFVADPALMYNLFWRTPDTGQVTGDHDYVTEMTTRDKRILQVTTVEELRAVEEALLSKPILLKINMNLEVSLAVLLNTLHPNVKQSMVELFSKGAEAISRDKNFCLEFDLGPCIERWFARLLGQDQGSFESFGSGFYVTNSTPYEHCFDCRGSWMFCAPLCLGWLMVAPCYVVYRVITVKDSDVEFNLPVVLRSPMDGDVQLERTPNLPISQQPA